MPIEMLVFELYRRNAVGMTMPTLRVVEHLDVIKHVTPRHIPIGHVGIGDVTKFYEWEFNNWLYPAMCSVLAVLGGILVFFYVWRKPDSYLR